MCEARGYQPQRAVSMGMICFFRLMTLGRNRLLSLGLGGEGVADDVIAAHIQQLRTLHQHVRQSIRITMS